MTGIGGLSAPVYAILFLCPFMIGVGQILFKMASQKLATNGATVFNAVFDPLFIAGAGIYALATVLWLYVLKSVPLAYAYSFMALSFVIVPLLAAWWLGETLTLKYAAGASLIMVGLVVVQS